MINQALKFIVLLPVHIYRLVISPWFGPKCRYYPSCSCYMKTAVEKHGVFKGGILGVARLFRCHPIEFLGGGSGVDPVPENFELFSRDSSDKKGKPTFNTKEKKIR